MFLNHEAIFHIVFKKTLLNPQRYSINRKETDIEKTYPNSVFIKKYPFMVIMFFLKPSFLFLIFRKILFQTLSE